jgi:hypothetical protein
MPHQMLKSQSSAILEIKNELHLAATASTALLLLALLSIALSSLNITETLINLSVANLTFSLVDFTTAVLFLITTTFACSVFATISTIASGHSLAVDIYQFGEGHSPVKSSSFGVLNWSSECHGSEAENGNKECLCEMHFVGLDRFS